MSNDEDTTRGRALPTLKAAPPSCTDNMGRRMCAVCGTVPVPSARTLYCTRACSNNAAQRRHRGKPIEDAAISPRDRRNRIVPEAIRAIAKKITVAAEKGQTEYRQALQEAWVALKRSEKIRKARRSQ